MEKLRIQQAQSPQSIFPHLSVPVSLLQATEIMAATLCCLKLPLLPQKPLRGLSKLPILPNPSNQNYLQILHMPSKDLHRNTPSLEIRFSSPHNPCATFLFRHKGKMRLPLMGSLEILEGRTFSLIHPIVMGGLFFYTLWSGDLGWQFRRVRTIRNEMNELKKQVKPTPVTLEGTPVEAAPSPVELKIQRLTELGFITTKERKELLKGSYRDRHFNAGSMLLGFGVFESIAGGINTWFRTGQLFPGPHLFAGAAITVLWAAAAAALVPPMRKGSETARNLHIALNAVNVLLFIWQIPTGFDIVLKVLEFTKWP